jgi:hypothetical protein
MKVYSGSAIPAFRRHVTMLFFKPLALHFNKFRSKRIDWLIFFCVIKICRGPEVGTRCFGTWCRVVWYIDTDVSEQPSASVFTVGETDAKLYTSILSLFSLSTLSSDIPTTNITHPLLRNRVVTTKKSDCRKSRFIECISWRRYECRFNLTSEIVTIPYLKHLQDAEVELVRYIAWIIIIIGFLWVFIGIQDTRYTTSWIIYDTCTMGLGSTQPLTEMSTRNLPGGKGRPARKSDNLTAICEPIV